MYWYNNFESVFQASDTIWRASLSQIVTNLLDLLTSLGLWCGWRWTGKYISSNFQTLSQIGLKTVFLCVFPFKRLKRKFDIEKLQNCVISGEILTYCAPQIQYTPAQAPWSPIFTQNRKWASNSEITKWAKNCQKDGKLKSWATPMKTTNCH